MNNRIIFVDPTLTTNPYRKTLEQIECDDGGWACPRPVRLIGSIEPPDGDRPILAIQKQRRPRKTL